MNTELKQTILTVLGAVIGGSILLWGAASVLGFVFRHWITLLVVVSAIVGGTLALTMQRK